MARRRNVSYTIPVALIEQVTTRGEVSGRSRNEEVRQLLAYGLHVAGDGEILVELPPGPTIRTVVWLDHDVAAGIGERAKRFHRHLSTELVLLVAHAIQTITNRDLALLRAMMQREDQAATSH